ncbi:aminoglycoside phosphotransferase family protein [Coleofasciculus sp. E2-BRE-01]|uniref:aminoglycoside phosphotransferase family protein n=1 Tax=Coleofasciculus sp. E2-BRE-01 TaxID=3069524 RepID=UPI0032FAD8B4
MKIKLSSNNVVHYLIAAGILQETNVESIKFYPKPSNNFIFLTLDLPNGNRLIVKQDCFYQDDDIKNRIRRELQFHDTLQSCPDLCFTPSLNLEILYVDNSNAILIYQYPKGYLNLVNFYKSQKNFPMAISRWVGVTLGTLHRETLNSRNCYDFMNETIEGKYFYQFPYPGHLLDKPSLESLVEEFPLEGFPFMAVYQRSESLRTAVTELVAKHNHYCLTHNKIRLDNILVPINLEILLSKVEPSDESIIKIVNWETCSWGDPAFDLGTVIAGYLLLWLNSIIVHPAINLEQSLRLATVPLELIQPSVVTLTRSYISSFPKILEEYPDFINQIIRFTGLALIYEIIERLQSFKTFNNQCIYILHLAKTLLCRPEESFKSVFGIKNLE